MSYKEELLRYNQTEALGLTEGELHSKVENTIARTFMWVAAVLFLSFGIAYSASLGLLPLPFNMTLYWVSWIGGLALIFFMSWRWQRMSYTTLAVLLLLFGFLEGYGLTGVFLIYELGSIYQMFLTTSVMFGLLAVAGYYTKIDVARVGTVLFVALIGLIVALVANIFWQNSTFDLWISIIGLIIFAGFIIYDMNVLKQQALVGDKRIELLMALGLFINFVNIFLFLLNLFGRE